MTIKLSEAMEQHSVEATKAFHDSALRQLRTLGISSEARLDLGKRRTLRIKDKEIFGYEVILVGLTAEESIIVQEHGLGGRHHMGCGMFVPIIALGGGE